MSRAARAGLNYAMTGRGKNRSDRLHNAARISENMAKRSYMKRDELEQAYAKKVNDYLNKYGENKFKNITSSRLEKDRQSIGKIAAMNALSKNQLVFGYPGVFADVQRRNNYATDLMSSKYNKANQKY